jgi:probable F420-dependent oxidoreductase
MSAPAFRFGTLVMPGDRDTMLTFARWTQDVGLDVIVTADHLSWTPDALTTLMFLADVTDRIRIGSYVMCIDFHQPVVLARALANLDELSGGRLEIGLGAGYIRQEYESAGITLAPGMVRFERLQEATTILKAMLAEDRVTYQGRHFQVVDQLAVPRPRQRPRPPILLGGGGPKMLAWAASEADIVSLTPRSSPAGNARLSGMGAKAVHEQAAIVHRVAADRQVPPMLNAMLWHLELTSNRREAARRWLDSIRHGTAPLAVAFAKDEETTVDDILESPFLAFGTPAEIAEHLLRARSETGISYWTLVPRIVEPFLSVLEILKGG